MSWAGLHKYLVSIRMNLIGLFALCVTLVLGAQGAQAEEVECSPVVGHLASFEGAVEVQRDGTDPWLDGRLGLPLCQGDSIRVGENARAAAALINGAVLRLDQNTAMRLTNIAHAEEESSFLDLIVGAFQSLSRKPRKLAVNTPYLNATIEGTEFMLSAAPDRSQLIVFEGVVIATNDQGELVLTQGQAAEAVPGAAPTSVVVVRPRDAVQWSLYYPPVLATGVAPGETDEAFRALEAAPESARDAAFFLERAALRLSVGQSTEARADIDEALARNPDSGLAYALSTVIAVVLNDDVAALADGERAVALDPSSAPAKIALSYALQSQFRLPEARDLMQQAVDENPEDALAWARLSELWLMLGYNGESRDAGDKARELQPDLARGQIIAGFAALAEFDSTAALVAFDRAIELDSANPLAWLGRGLAQIRKGQLAEGTKDLEMAVGLDSNNALLRAYLGKAYFEEKRAPLDSEQFDISKELDPFDPTPWLYSAIAKQTENQPGEALEDLQESIALNDNRAVYRGRLELDKDQAARGTSLGRVYDDLGFLQLGINEASKSLTLDPGNASAHRFLSDIYLDERRREIARVSDLLQAQLLQDVNLNPIQPSISTTNLNIITNGGPADAGFNEFTPLFESNGVQLDVTGGAGTQSTLAGEGVISGLYEGYSLSAGGFHFNTAGFRDNNDIDHNIYDVFGQAALTPKLNVQAEVRNRNTSNGDIALNFDPDQFSENFNRDLEQTIARVGGRYTPSPNSNFLGSFIYSDREEKTFDSIDSGVPGFPIDTDASVDDEGYQAEGQYIFEHPRFNAIVGGAYSDIDSELKADVTFGGFPIASLDTNDTIQSTRGYLYTNISYPESVTWTLGVSGDNYEQDAFEINEVNPKLGVQWNVLDDLVLRGAYFKTVKPALVNNRTLEPTQLPASINFSTK